MRTMQSDTPEEQLAIAQVVSSVRIHDQATPQKPLTDLWKKDLTEKKQIWYF